MAPTRPRLATTGNGVTEARSRSRRRFADMDFRPCHGKMDCAGEIADQPR